MNRGGRGGRGGCEGAEGAEGAEELAIASLRAETPTKTFVQTQFCAKFLSKTEITDRNIGFGRNFGTRIGQKTRMLGAYFGG